MIGTDDGQISTQDVVAAVDQLQASLAILFQAHHNATSANVSFLNPMALDLLAHHVGRLRLLSDLQPEAEPVSSAVDDAINDLLSSAQALTAYRIDRPQ